MKNKNKHGIKKQFSLFIVFTTVITLIFHGCILFYIVQENAERSKQYTESIATNISNTILTITNNLEKAGYAFSINQTLSSLYSGNSTLEPKDNIDTIYDMSRSIIEYNHCLLDVVVVDTKGITTSYFAGVNDTIIEELKKYYNFSNVEDTERAFFFFPTNSPLSKDYFIYIAPLYNMNALYKNLDKTATVVLICKISAINDLFTSVNEDTSTFAILFKNNLIATNNTVDPTEQVEALINQSPTKVEKDIPELNMKLIGMSNLSFFEKNKTFLTVYILLSVTVLITVLFATMFFVKKTITIPILKLKNDMGQIVEHSRNRRISMGDSSDINSIAAKINNMLDKIEDTNRKIFETQNCLYETEILKNEAELYALQSQVNPHFLYNTLQCVRGLAVYHNVNEIATIATAMSELFRYSIKGTEFVTIAEELKIIELYLEIIKIRFSGRYTYKIKIDDRILGAQTIKMLIQPIVENSVVHGLSDLEEGGELLILGELNEGTIVFKVIDNGIGISDENIKIIDEALKNDFHYSIGQNNKCLGLYNISRRIKLHFGNDYGLSIKSDRNKTEVKLTFPYTEISENTYNDSGVKRI